MPCKIAVTVTNDLNQDQRMHRICNSLHNAGYEVILIGRHTNRSTLLLDQDFDQKRLHCIFNKGVFFYIEYNLRLLFFLLFSKVDILYAVDLDTLGAVGMTALIKRKKLIYDAHEYFVEVPELEGSRIKKWLWNLIAKMFIPYSDLNITVNRELAIVLKDKYKYDFHVVRSVPLLDDIEITKAIDKPRVILYQGVLNKGRGLEEAINWIAKSKENLTLHIIGEGDLSQELRELKAKIDINDRVKFLGWKTPEELDRITPRAWVGLNLLDGKSLNYKYSLANKFFNYMHAGVPSINMNFPVYKRYCKEENVGVCISDLTESALEKAIIPLLSDKLQYDKMVDATITARKKYTWQVEEVKFLQLIKEISAICV